MPTPLQVFACQPEPLYFNNWADLGPGQGAGFHASPEEIRRAAELRDQKQLRRALRKQKGALFLAIMQVCRGVAATPCEPNMAPMTLPAFCCRRGMWRPVEHCCGHPRCC